VKVNLPLFVKAVRKHDIHLDVRERVILDSICATALKLDTMSLETLDLNNNSVTSCGIQHLLSFARTMHSKRAEHQELRSDDGLLKLGRP
jgi:hypothetical protein